MRIEKYFHLVIGIILMVSAVCLAVYGIYVDRLYLCGEGFVVAILALMLIHGYREAVQMEKEEDGI